MDKSKGFPVGAIILVVFFTFKIPAVRTVVVHGLGYADRVLAGALVSFTHDDNSAVRNAASAAIQKSLSQKTEGLAAPSPDGRILTRINEAERLGRLGPGFGLAVPQGRLGDLTEALLSRPRFPMLGERPPFSALPAGDAPAPILPSR